MTRLLRSRAGDGSSIVISVIMDIIAITAMFIATYLGVKWASVEALTQQDHRDNSAFCTALTLMIDDCNEVPKHLIDHSLLTVDNARPWNLARLSASWAQRPETLSRMDRERLRTLLKAIVELDFANAELIDRRGRWQPAKLNADNAPPSPPPGIDQSWHDARIAEQRSYVDQLSKEVVERAKAAGSALGRTCEILREELQTRQTEEMCPTS